MLPKRLRLLLFAMPVDKCDELTTTTTGLARSVGRFAETHPRKAKDELVLPRHSGPKYKERTNQNVSSRRRALRACSTGQNSMG